MLLAALDTAKAVEVMDHAYVLDYEATLNRILTGASGISPEMALRLSKTLGCSPESWLAMQYNYDLWHARQHVRLGNVGRVKLTAA